MYECKCFNTLKGTVLYFPDGRRQISLSWINFPSDEPFMSKSVLLTYVYTSMSANACTHGTVY